MKFFKWAAALVFFFSVAASAANSDLKQVQNNHERAALAEKAFSEKTNLNEAASNVLKLIKTGKAVKPQNCTIGGGRCSFDSDCCSDNCHSGVCQAGAGGCTIGGGSCSFDSECCSDNCNSGTCQSGNGCTNGGGSCSFDSECCSGNCYSGTCQAACGSSGDSCTYDHECCGGNCNSLGRCGSEPIDCHTVQ